MNGIVHSNQFTETIWCINVECSANPNNIPPYQGHINSLESYDTQNIEHLIIGFMLYEPQIAHDFTEWTKQTLEYLHETQLFPNLKNVYLLHEYTKVSVSELPNHYMVFGHNTRYFLLRSEGTKKRSVGLNRFKSWRGNAVDPKALWLIGDVSNRPHKFPLLYKFADSKNLDQLDYSLTSKLNYSAQGSDFNKEDPQTYEHVVDIMNEVFNLNLDFNSLTTLYNKFQRTLPGDTFGEMVDNQVHSFDIANYCFPTEWNDASLIIMPETWFDNPGGEMRPFWEHNSYPTTEKTWKPIITKKPFMGISRFDLQEKTLEGLGYKTFRKYTSEPNLINEDISISEYISIAHKRITSFLDQMEDYQDGIRQDIEYNYKHHQTVLKEEWDLLYRSCPPLKHVDKHKVLRLFTVPTHNYIHTLPDEFFNGRIDYKNT